MVERIWQHETVVILASGPSLTLEDVDLVRGKARVIAINDTHRLAPWADVLYGSDRTWWPRHQGVPSFAGLKFGIGSKVGFDNPFRLYPDIRVLKNTGYVGLELDPRGLRSGENSGYAAINLAVHFGVARILLLGYDMATRHGEVHFFGKHEGMNNPTDAVLAGFRRRFPSLVDPLREIGVEVLNCTPGSSLDAFPMADLRESLGPQPLRSEPPPLNRPAGAESRPVGPLAISIQGAA